MLSKKIKLSAVAITALLLFAFCSQSNLKGKWYIKNVQNLVTHENYEEKNCYYFDFEGEKYHSLTQQGEQDGSWHLAGDTIMEMHMERTDKTYRYKIDQTTKDTLVISRLQDGNPVVRFSFNRKCAAFKE